MKFIELLRAGLEKSIKVLGIIFLFLIVIFCFAEILFRFIFNVSFPWAEELAIWSMVYLVFMGSAIDINSQSHARIEFFLNLLKPKLRYFIEFFNNIICAILSIFLAYKTFPIISRNMTDLSPGARIPMGILYISLGAGGIIFFLFFLIKAYEFAKAANKNYSEGERKEAL